MLASFGGADPVGIVGRNRESLQKTVEWIGSDRVVAHALDIEDSSALQDQMKDYDVGIIVLPDRKRSYWTIEAAMESGLNVVDESS